MQLPCRPVSHQLKQVSVLLGVCIAQSTASAQQLEKARPCRGLSELVYRGSHAGQQWPAGVPFSR